MVVIHIQMYKNIIEDILLDGDFGVNIIIKKLMANLKWPKLNLHLTICEWQIKQTIKPLELIFEICGISDNITFIVMHSNVLDSIYFMLIGRLWLKDEFFSHK